MRRRPISAFTPMTSGLLPKSYGDPIIPVAHKHEVPTATESTVGYGCDTPKAESVSDESGVVEGTKDTRAI